MKNYLILLFISFTTTLSAQDSLFCYNSGIVPEQELTSSGETDVFFKQQNSLILMPVMNEKEVVKLLQEKNNSDINKLIRKIKLSKALQSVGFSAIPEALFGLGFISIPNKEPSSGICKQNIGIGLVALSAVCLTSGFYLKKVRAKTYKKAIKKYNEIYN